MRVLSLSLLPLLASAAPFLSDTATDTTAPIFATQESAQLPNSYIVVFKDHVNEKTAADHHNWVQQIHNQVEVERTELKKRSQLPIVNDVFNGLKHTYNIAGNFMGYSGHFDDKVIEEVRKHPDVSSLMIFLFKRLLILDKTSLTINSSNFAHEKNALIFFSTLNLQFSLANNICRN